jgi:Caspase domain
MLIKTQIPQRNGGRILSLFITLIIAFIGFTAAHSQCPTEVSLNINRIGNVVTVKPGAQLSLEFNYSIANTTSCPGCIDQIMVGIDNQYLDCLYSGMPFVCPMQKKGSFKRNITAPAKPGTYKFYFNTTQDYSCKGNLYKPSSYIGTLNVEAPCSLTTTVSLNINNQGNRVIVKPGAALDMRFDYAVSNQQSCPGCITQVLWGIDSRYTGCIYNGTPAVCPATSKGQYIQRLNAPTEPGTYQVYVHPDQNYQCNPAAYKPSIAAGTIIVQADCPGSASVSLNMNGAGNNISVKPGQTIQMEIDYSLANQSSCPTCFSQLMLGYDNQYLVCLFDGTPGVCPAGSTGRASYRFTAPAIPGTYKIAYNFTQDYSCKPALYRPDHVIGSVQVLPDCSGSAAVTLTMNGLGNTISVKPGSPVNMQFSYNVSATAGRQDKPLRLLFGFENSYRAMIYEGNAAVCPSFSTGNANLSVTAPAEPGVYRIFYCSTDEVNSNAMAYKPVQEAGTLTVTCPAFVTVEMNGQPANYITAAPGTTVSMRFRYQVSGNPSCPGCKTQLLVGVNDQFLNCIFSDKAIDCPSGTTGYSTIDFTPPGPGYYKIYYTTAENEGCNSTLYKPVTLAGTINVPQVITEVTTEKSPDKPADTKPKPELPVTSAGGNFYALIIGVSNYKDERLNLDKPELDAAELKKILVSKYTFEDSTITILFSPTREKILEELFRFRKKVKANDNLLIFYAGHGYFDKDADQGYWWPTDAKPNNPANWLSNSDLKEQIKSIKSKHTLLISDACFSGGIFKTRDVTSFTNAPNDIQQLYKMPSRRAMTSGTLTTVPDKSVFLEYLAKNLHQNNSQYLSSQELFYRMRSAVIGNSPVVPQTGIIFQAGDEGGDFIFVLRK